MLRESFPVPDTGGAVSLVYSSSGARGYLSTLELRLTPPEGVPRTLRRVHLRISVEGALTEKTFEADPVRMEGRIVFLYIYNVTIEEGIRNVSYLFRRVLQPTLSPPLHLNDRT